MLSNQMFIPSKIKVGYQNRTDTYTQKLAYVIYFDEKGKLRKEASWEGWRDKKLIPNEFQNDPITGFVLNKEVGGVRNSWSSWNKRNEYVRVYDPRDFEFEISVSNLLFILQETSAIKGKGLDGEFVYAWNGTELVLLPVGCEEYKDCQDYTNRKGKKVSKEEIKEGFLYVLKDGSNVMYLGRFPFNQMSWRSIKDDSYNFNPIGKRHVFLELNTDENEGPYFVDSGFTKVAECISTTASSDFANARDYFLKSKYYAGIASVQVIENKEKIQLQNIYDEQKYLIKNGDNFSVAQIRGPYNNQTAWYWEDVHHQYHMIRKSAPFNPQVTNGVLSIPPIDCNWRDLPDDDRENLKTYNLYITMDSGTQMKVI
jgi:hypothetical protein